MASASALPASPSTTATTATPSTPAGPSPATERQLASGLARLRQLDDRRAFTAIAGDWAIVAVAIAVALRLRHPLVDLAALVVVAGRQVALLNLVHAASHAALFARKRSNERLQALYAWPILDAVAIYRGPHLDHHREIAERSDDRFAFLHGELRLPERGAWGAPGSSWCGRCSATRRCRSCAARSATCGLTDGTARASPCSGRSPSRSRGGSARSARSCATGCCPWCWLHPVFLLWGEVADHHAAASGTRNHTGLFHAALTNGHALYHDVHHRFPFVPFYGEPAAHAWLVAAGDRMETATSALGFLRAVYGAAPVEATGPERAAV